jgi:hypothetical protein
VVDVAILISDVTGPFYDLTSGHVSLIVSHINTHTSRDFFFSHLKTTEKDVIELTREDKKKLVKEERRRRRKKKG